ncbi:MAG: MBL fold metallo-hydrolase [Pyrinomonadaceae bacterium]
MKRLLTIASAVLCFWGAAWAHGGVDGHGGPQQDVMVKTTKISGNVYMLQGRGGNIGALVGMDGLLIIDDDYKVVGPALRDALKALGYDSPRFLLNTHWHGDHTENNESFGKTGTVIIAHDNVRRRLMAPPTIFGRTTPPYAPIALPIVTYAQSITIHLNGEEIRAIHYPNGHTDGDTVVFFMNSKVVHLGDDFFVGKFPFVDIDSGGSVQGLINNIGQLISDIPGDAKLIPGHGPLATVDDLKTFRQMLIETSTIVQDAMKKKMSVDEIKKAGLPEKYKDWGTGFIKTDSWIDILYRSYSKK